MRTEKRVKGSTAHSLGRKALGACLAVFCGSYDAAVEAAVVSLKDSYGQGYG